MIKYIFVFIITLFSTVAFGATVSTEKLIVGGHPYVDIRSRLTITEVDNKAMEEGKRIMCASPYTISTGQTVTISSVFEPVRGCMIADGGGSVYFAGGIAGNPHFKWLTGWGSGVGGLNWLNVKWFGAVGDGVTNDYNAVQRAFVSAAKSGTTGTIVPTVYFPAGTYFRPTDSNSWLPTSSVIIDGAGPLVSKLKFNDFNTVGGRKDGINFTSVPAGGTVEVHGITLEGEYAENGYKLGGVIHTDGMAQGGTAGDAVTNGTVILASSASAVDDYYNGTYLGIFSGAAKHHDRLILDYDGATRTATIKGHFYFTPDTTSHYYIGAAPAMGFSNLLNLSKVTIHDTHFKYIRGQALQITGVKDVSVTHNELYMCARGGISVRRSSGIISNNRLQYVGDDSIFNSQESTATWSAQNTVVADNTIVDSNGMRFIGARQLLVTGNQITRPTSFGIKIGGIPLGEAYQPQQSIIVSNNLIVDPIVRGTLWYDLASNVVYGIWLDNWRTNATGWALPGAYSAATTTILKPENYLYQEITGTTNVTAGFGLSITGNQILSTLPTGTTLSLINGTGFFNSRFATSLSDAFLDPVIPAKYLDDLTPIAFVGPWHSVLVANNQTSSRGKSSVLLGRNSTIMEDEDDETIVVSSADYDYAYMGMAIKGNNFSRSISTPVISTGTISSIGRTWDVAIENNTIDGDPYVESTSRTDPIDGSWDSGADIFCVDMNYVYGITLRGNTFKNCYGTHRIGRANIIKDNLVHATAAAVGYNIGNKGVGVIPSGGPEFFTIDVDSDPTSTAYQRVNTQMLLSSAVVPTTGRYVTGHVVSNSTPSIGAAFDLIGWKRLTTGSTHTLGTDWGAISAYPCQQYLMLNNCTTRINSSITGTTAETSLFSCTVPGNTLGTVGSLYTDSTWSYTNSANNKNPRIVFGNMSVHNVNRTTSKSVNVLATVHNKTAATQTGNTAAGAVDAQTATSGNVITGAVDTNQPVILDFRCTLTSAAEACELMSATVWAIRPICP